MARRIAAFAGERLRCIRSPVSAPKVILLKTLRLKRVNGGATSRKGWYAGACRARRLKNGSDNQHGDRDQKNYCADIVDPLADAEARGPRCHCVAMTANEAPTMSHLLEAIHAAPGIT